MTEELPVKKDNFLAEVETMDLSKLRDKQFLVAISTGPRDGVKLLASSLHGPYDYIEMLQEVGTMWNDFQHHARVVVCDKVSKNKVVTLDENTTDYIECHYNDLIMDEMISNFDKDYTCQAGLFSEEESSDPRHKDEDAAEQNSLPG